MPVRKGYRGTQSNIAEYNRVRSNYLRNIRRAEIEGAEYNRTTIPKVPKIKNKRAIRELERLNKPKNRYANERWYDPEKGEWVSGTEYRKKRKQGKTDDTPPNIVAIWAVNEKMESAVEYVNDLDDTGLNSLKKTYAEEIYDDWQESLALAQTSEDGLIELERYLLMNEEPIAENLDHITYGSTEEEVTSGFHLLKLKFPWSPL